MKTIGSEYIRFRGLRFEVIALHSNRILIRNVLTHDSTQIETEKHVAELTKDDLRQYISQKFLELNGVL